MDSILYNNFKKESYNGLSDDEKKDLIIQTIRSIQKENDLNQIDVEFSDEQFGFDFENKKVIINLSSNNDSYVILTGIIHELRHQWQSEKKGVNPLNSSGYEYILSSHEADAHEFAIEEMKKYQNFFNKDDFDIYLINLEHEYLKKKNSAIYEYQRSGYYDVKDISKKMSLYEEQSALFTAEELKEIGEPEIVMVQFKNGITGTYKLNQNNNNIFLLIPGMSGTINGTDLYIKTFNVQKDLNTDIFVEFLQIYIECLEEFRDIGLNVHCSQIHFPPAIIGLGGLEKNEYESFLKSLNCTEGIVTFESLKSHNYDKDHVLKRTIPMWPEGKKNTFGINYLKEYTDEQIDVLDMAIEWMLDLDDLEYSLEDTEEMETPNLPIAGFFASHQYKKEYSPRKLSLILAGQKQGLNTFYYENLDEEQIEQLMMLQLEGFAREDWFGFMQEGLDMIEIRKKLEEEKDIIIIDKLTLDENYNIVLQDNEPNKINTIIIDPEKRENFKNKIISRIKDGEYFSTNFRAMFDGGYEHNEYYYASFDDLDIDYYEDYMDEKEEYEKLYILQEMYQKYGESFMIPTRIAKFDFEEPKIVMSDNVLIINGMYVVDFKYKFDTFKDLEDWLMEQNPEFMKLEENKQKLQLLQSITLEDLENMFLGNELTTNTQEIFSASDISAALQEISREGLTDKTQLDLIDFVETRNSSIEEQK